MNNLNTAIEVLGAAKVESTTSPAKVMEWANRRGVRILGMPGSYGDQFVQVDKHDFQLKMSLQINPLRDTELSSTYYFEPVRRTIYSA